MTRVSDDRKLGDRLRQHVQMLAGESGERNIWRYEALDRAALHAFLQRLTTSFALEWPYVGLPGPVWRQDALLHIDNRR